MGASCFFHRHPGPCCLQGPVGEVRQPGSLLLGSCSGPWVRERGSGSDCSKSYLSGKAWKGPSGPERRALGEVALTCMGRTHFRRSGATRGDTLGAHPVREAFPPEGLLAFASTSGSGRPVHRATPPGLSGWGLQTQYCPGRAAWGYGSVYKVALPGRLFGRQRGQKQRAAARGWHGVPLDLKTSYSLSASLTSPVQTGAKVMPTVPCE